MSNVRFRKSSMLSNKDRKKRELERTKQEIADLTPAIYASLALALNKYWGFGYKRIERLFYQSQYIWDEYGRDMDGMKAMIDLCERETGIKLQSE